MATDTEDKRHALDLQFLEGILNDKGIRTHFAEKSEEYALSFVSVEILDTIMPGEAYVQMMYIPSADIMDETNLLQLFAYLPEELPAASDEVKSILGYLNTRTPLGYFAAGEDGKLFYRYVLTLPRFDVPKQDLFWEVFDLFTKTYAVFGGTVTAFAKGEISMDEVKSRISE